MLISQLLVLRWRAAVEPACEWALALTAGVNRDSASALMRNARIDVAAYPTSARRQCAPERRSRLGVDLESFATIE